ncbi:MAG: DEAD/DEAH box helicase [Myxococcota bacterium]
MIDIAPLSPDAARSLLDFRGRSAAASAFADAQLEGAVALHNILAREGFAYLADEVGMGKTYVALGVMALLRHAHPGLRVLYIAPKENIQRKWYKELGNFVANNWRNDDFRVRALGRPGFDVVMAESLQDLAAKARLDANRDVIVRMTSFSVGLSKEATTWNAKRDQLLRLFPWLDPAQFALYSKKAFKDAYARAVNVALPVYDLVIVDEGHNLKHGYSERVAARNRVLGLVLGREDAQVPYLDGGGPRADRILVLSATPVEVGWGDLWNQMNVLGKGHLAPILRRGEEAGVSEGERLAAARRFIVRRLTGIPIGGQIHTKNMYRREWRQGGVATHDEPLPLSDTRQRLIVALAQKKVMDVLSARRDPAAGRFSRSFQMGMLASFESFAATARVEIKGEDGESEQRTFEESDQAERSEDRQGVDRHAIDGMARRYLERFHTSLPHPKMDAVAAAAAEAMLDRGEKSLIFVRRIASVPELCAKIAQRYDDWVFAYLERELRTGPVSDLRQAVAEYQLAKLRERDRHGGAAADADEDHGAGDSFFAWFFRGEALAGEASFRGRAAAFRKNRLRGEGSVHSTLLEDNYARFVLGADPLRALAGRLGATAPVLLRKGAWLAFRRPHQVRYPRAQVFTAYQEAALRLVADGKDSVAAEARAILRRTFADPPADTDGPIPEGFPRPDDILGAPTLFSELEARPALCAQLWPASTASTFEARFVERERRRQLLVSAMLLGHAYIDLWLLAVRSLRSLAAGERDEDGAASLAIEFLTRLEEQQGQPGLTSWRELHDIAAHFPLLCDVNFDQLRDTSLSELPKYYQRTLGRQTPVAGMFGTVNTQVVRQFRMPGYPYVLVTTDLLREGEDLHPFCAHVVHYGIEWTSSAMEQRTGRVDRIGSLTHRRLTRPGLVTAEGTDRLQVQYPHLTDTVELFQVREVYRRMNRFVDLLHDRASGAASERSDLDIARVMHQVADVAPITGTLTTRFAIKPEWCEGGPSSPVAAREEEILKLFADQCDALDRECSIIWRDRDGAHHRLGTAWIADRELCTRGADTSGRRQQPFHAFLLPARRTGRVLLRIVSPVGIVAERDAVTVSRIGVLQRAMPSVAVFSGAPPRTGDGYNLAARVDLPFGAGLTQHAEVRDVLRRVCVFADQMEQALLRHDLPIEHFVVQLRRERGDV